MANIVEALKASLTALERQERDEWAELMDRAVEYSDGEMLRDTQELLRVQYKESNSAAIDGERIQPVPIPLLKKFVDDTATAYTQGVVRKLVHRETGEQDARGEELTKQLEDCLGEVEFDSMRETLDRRVTTLRSCCEFMQIENGELDPVLFNPQHVLPIRDPDKPINLANQKSYMGFVLDTQQRLRNNKKVYAVVTPSQSFQFEAESIDKFETNNIIDGSNRKNPLRWPMQVVDAQGRPTNKVVDQPVMLLNVWHRTKPMGELIPMAEPVGLNVARQLNVSWSSVLDVLRFQPGAIPVWKVSEVNRAPAKAPTGVRFPAVVLGGGLEDVTYSQPGNDYQGLVYCLTSLAQTLALTLQLSPGDFSLEQRAAMSGFAKLVEKLPQLGARKRKTRHYARMEQRTWPALGATLIWLGKLPEEARNYKLITTFEDIKIPRSVDERIAEEKHDIEHGFRSAAEMLAERDGISIDDAEARIEENLAKKPAAPQPQGGGLFGGGRFAAAVRGNPQQGKRDEQRQQQAPESDQEE